MSSDSTAPSPRDAEVDLRGEAALKARHELLIYRDYVIGLEAENASLKQSVDRLTLRRDAQRERIQELRDKLAEVKRRADRLQRQLDGRGEQPPPQPSAARRSLSRLKNGLA